MPTSRAWQAFFTALLVYAVLFAQSVRGVEQESEGGRDASTVLPRGVPEQQGVSSRAILEFIKGADQIDAMHSFMLVRHGHVIAEGWWKPFDAKTPHVLYSLSKSFASTAVGLAVAEGKLSLDDEVLKFFPDEVPAEVSANLKSMRVRDLLRMSSGNQSEATLWSDTPGSKNFDQTWTRKFLAHPVPFKPGTHFLYNSPATYMCSAIVQKATGKSALEYLKPRLFVPLGFEQPQWLASPQGVSLGAFGFFARTEEIAKFGQLYLRRGVWNGRRLLPEAWVDEATSLRTSNGSAPTSDWDQGYGYQFWRSRHGYRGDGAFGQYCLVLPEQDAVIAITSGVRDMQSVMNLVWDKLLPAMKDEPLPAEDGRDQLNAKLASLTVKLPTGDDASALASNLSGRTFKLGKNDRELQNARIEFGEKSATLTFGASDREITTEVGLGKWIKNERGFANGLEKLLGMPTVPLVAAAGAWSTENTFVVKLVAYESPYYSTMKFKFEDGKLVIDSEHNVAFGPTKLATIEGVE